MRITELKTEIETAKKKLGLLIDGMETSDNPHTKECYSRHFEAIKTLNAVLSRIQGNKLSLVLL